MPRDRREGPIVIHLTGQRAHLLAERLLAPDPSPATDRLWDEIAALGGRASRVGHDWDPATGRLTLMAQGAARG
ncbi:MAG TPA: hypothetical protein VM899_08330 [Rubellimicrobium sp.]|nr:hypothetical protein [Rubellimicrobium sp.]